MAFSRRSGNAERFRRFLSKIGDKLCITSLMRWTRQPARQGPSGISQSLSQHFECIEFQSNLARGYEFRGGAQISVSYEVTDNFDQVEQKAATTEIGHRPDPVREGLKRFVERERLFIIGRRGDFKFGPFAAASRLFARGAIAVAG
jgi:hypothetical protein